MAQDSSDGQEFVEAGMPMKWTAVFTGRADLLCGQVAEVELEIFRMHGKCAGGWSPSQPNQAPPNIKRNLARAIARVVQVREKALWAGQKQWIVAMESALEALLCCLEQRGTLCLVEAARKQLQDTLAVKEAECQNYSQDKERKMWARIPRQRSDWKSVNGVSPPAVVWESDPECANLSSECEGCVAFENNLPVEGGNKKTRRNQREKRAKQEHRQMVEAGEAIEIPGAVWLSPFGPLTEEQMSRQASMWAFCDMLDEVMTEETSWFL